MWIQSFPNRLFGLAQNGWRPFRIPCYANPIMERVETMMRFVSNRLSHPDLEFAPLPN